MRRKSPGRPSPVFFFCVLGLPAACVLIIVSPALLAPLFWKDDGTVSRSYPACFHLTNLLLHVLCAAALFVVAGRGRRRWYHRLRPSAAGVAAVLFFLWGFSFFYHVRLLADPVRLFERAAVLAPGDSRIRVGLARAYLEEGRFAEAEALLIGVLRQDPAQPQAYHVLGQAYYRMNRKSDAEAVWRNGMAVAGGFAGFYAALGVIEAQKGETQEALFYFKEASRRDPASPVPHKNAALACYNAGLYREALARWERARQLGMRLHPDLSVMMEKARRQLAVADP